MRWKISRMGALQPFHKETTTLAGRGGKGLPLAALLDLFVRVPLLEKRAVGFSVPAILPSCNLDTQVKDLSWSVSSNLSAARLCQDARSESESDGPVGSVTETSASEVIQSSGLAAGKLETCYKHFSYEQHDFDISG